MKSQNLRLDANSFVPDAVCRLYAVMCFPKDAAGRGKVIQPTWTAETSDMVPIHYRGALAGNLLMTRIQLNELGYLPTLNRAIPLVRSHAVLGEIPGYYRRNMDPTQRKMPVSQTKIREAWEEFHSVAHFWAVLEYWQQLGRREILSGRIETLPLFFGYASYFLDAACHTPAPERKSCRHLMARSEAWWFTLPENLKSSRNLKAEPLHDVQLQALKVPSD